MKGQNEVKFLGCVTIRIIVLCFLVCVKQITVFTHSRKDKMILNTGLCFIIDALKNIEWQAEIFERNKHKRKITDMKGRNDDTTV